MICTVGGLVDFSAVNAAIVFNLQIPHDENWDFITCHANLVPTDLIRVKIFLNTILTYDFVFASASLPYVINQRINGGTVVRMELERYGVSLRNHGAYMEINRLKS